MPLTWNEEGWDTTLKGIVREFLDPKAEVIANACNREMLEAGNSERDAAPGYRAGTQDEKRAIAVAGGADEDDAGEGTYGQEGAKLLKHHDYRATVITATNSAKYDNAQHNRLVNNLHLAEGTL